VPAKLPTQFPAAVIAAAAGGCKRTAIRRALRENWQRGFNGNQFVFEPPRKLLAKCRAIARLVEPRGLRPSALIPARRAELMRASNRLFACLMLASALDAGESHERALVRVAHVATFKCSARSLRRWFTALESQGIAGLAERKRGRVGRKPEVKA